MDKALILEYVEAEVRNAAIADPIKRYELAKRMIADGFAKHGHATSPIQVAHGANIIKGLTGKAGTK
jgi:hypothetical protein